MKLRLHAIILALNEEIFIENQLRTLYPHCSGISVLTQYDRDWYGKRVQPDRTLSLVANFADPEGKIQLVVRRWRDQAAALNMEMAALSSRPHRAVQSHGSAPDAIAELHETPDYFWIVDADEFYDPQTLPRILDRLASKRPRGMRMFGLNYLGTWNRRVPKEVVEFCNFGFLRPGVRIKFVRRVTWNESRLSKLLCALHLPDFSARVFGFDTCPMEVGFFHHGCWLGDRQRLASKVAKSAHNEQNNVEYQTSILRLKTIHIPTPSLPENIRDMDWQPGLLE